jgi:hypothetical protein
MDSKPVDKPTPVNPRREGLNAFGMWFGIFLICYTLIILVFSLQPSSSWIYGLIILSMLAGYGEYKMQTDELTRLTDVDRVNRVNSVNSV